MLKSRRAKSASVDESLPVSSGLLNLVIVLVNDVKQHRLERDIKRRVSATQRRRKKKGGRRGGERQKG